MKVCMSKICNMADDIVCGNRICKTAPYPNDSTHFSCTINVEKSFFDCLKEIFGFRTKLNSRSFSVGLDDFRGPYAASHDSVKLSNEYAVSNFLTENEKIINGFRDGGHNAEFTKYGDIISGNREVITIDKYKDGYLRNAIAYVKHNTEGMAENDKVKFVYNVIREISGDFKKSDLRSEYLAKQEKGKEVPIGKIFENECATCRHKGIMFKLLAEEAGLNVRLLRGLAFDLGGFGRHVWNEVKLKDGKKLLIDIQNSRIIDISSKKSLKNPELASYLSCNKKSIYCKE